MDWRRFGGAIYARLDRDDEIIACILDICRKEHVRSAVFSGIGGCSAAELQTFLPETGEFETHAVEGMLELVSMNGSVVSDEKGGLHHHAHALLSYREGGEDRIAAGHVKSIAVLYTAEIEIRPVEGGVVRQRPDPETGTGFWDFRQS